MKRFFTYTPKICTYFRLSELGRRQWSPPKRFLHIRSTTCYIALMDKWQTFLEEIQTLPDRATAMKSCGITPSELYDRLDNDEGFRKLYDRSFEIGISSVEDVCLRRAVLGVEEPIIRDGMHVANKTVYSDSLLIFWLKGSRKKWRMVDSESTHDISMEARTLLKSIFSESGSTSPSPSTSESVSSSASSPVVRAGGESVFGDVVEKSDDGDAVFRVPKRRGRPRKLDS